LYSKGTQTVHSVLTDVALFPPLFPVKCWYTSVFKSYLILIFYYHLFPSDGTLIIDNYISVELLLDITLDYT